MSRQITIDAVRAFNNSYKFKRDNTEVRRVCSISDSEVEGALIQTELRLHGNLIAYKINSGVFISNGGYTPEPNRRGDRPTGSVTTKERLNGLSGVEITVKNYQWYLNGRAWDGSTIKIG